MLNRTQIYYSSVSDLGRKSLNNLESSHKHTYCSSMTERLQLTSHQPVKGTRSRPHPRQSHFHSHWCSPLLSFCWTQSSLLCLRTGILSHRWTPTCKRHRMHRVTSVGTLWLHTSTAKRSADATGMGVRSYNVNVMHEHPACQQHTSQGVCGCTRPSKSVIQCNSIYIVHFQSATF